jgi:hypothetical protein
MAGKARAILFGLLALVAAVRPAAGENPRISIKVENATFAEAAAALSRASGIPVEHWNRRLPEGVARQLEPLLDEKASFDWTNVTFARALRQLCDRYNLQPLSPTGRAYVLHPAGVRPAPPAMPPGLFEKNGVRLFLRSLSFTTSRRRWINFPQGVPDASGYNSLELSIGGTIPDGDADTIAGLGSLVAKDDRGTVLMLRQTGSAVGTDITPGLFPDEWTTGFFLAGLHPMAKKLEWLEGDLIVFRQVRRHRVEFSVPVNQDRARQQAGEAEVELTRFETGDPMVSGPSVEAQVSTAHGSALRPRGFSDFLPMLVGASGRIYAPTGVGFGSSSSPKGARFQVFAQFQPIDEPVVRIVLQLVERSQPEKLLTFRMQDIPLPPEAVPAPPPRPAPRPLAPPLPARNTPAGGAERPYYQEDGGNLVSRSQIQGQPAGEGILSLGLSRKTGGEWSSIRWIEVEVNNRGEARLPNLKPGTYRIRRVYRPREERRGTGPGRWLDTEVVIDVVAGREVILPPLRWVAEPEKSDER